MSTMNEKYIMFSYAWEGDHKKVDQIASQCTAAGIPIWMDIRNGLGPNLIDGMAEAVEESLAVCCFITPEYQESKYCKMELEYANKLNKPIIPCFLTGFQPRKWLGILTAGLIYYDFSYDSSDIVVSQLINHMKKDILKRKTRISSKPHPLPVKIESQSNSFERNFPQKFASGECHSNEQKHVPEHRPTADSFVTRDWPIPPKIPIKKITSHNDFLEMPASSIGKTSQKRKTSYRRTAQ